MDDTTKNIPPQQFNQPAQQQDNTSVQSSQTQQFPSTPVSAPSREAGPSMVKTNEAISQSTPELEISPELQEMGVEAKTEVPAIPQGQDKFIVHAKETTPVTTQPTGLVTLPMTQTQAQTIVKTHKKVKDSLVWLAMLILRQWQLSEWNKNHKKKEAA